MYEIVFKLTEEDYSEKSHADDDYMQVGTVRRLRVIRGLIFTLH